MPGAEKAQETAEYKTPEDEFLTWSDYYERNPHHDRGHSRRDVKHGYGFLEETEGSGIEVEENSGDQKRGGHAQAGVKMPKKPSPSLRAIPVWQKALRSMLFPCRELIINIEMP